MVVSWAGDFERFAPNLLSSIIMVVGFLLAHQCKIAISAMNSLYDEKNFYSN
jgi:hypothetical protein